MDLMGRRFTLTGLPKMQAANLCALFITAAWVRLFLSRLQCARIVTGLRSAASFGNRLARTSNPMRPQTEAIADEAPK